MGFGTKKIKKLIARNHCILHIGGGIWHISILDSYFVRLKEMKYVVKIVCDKKFTKKEGILKNRHVVYRENELQ